MDFSAGSNVFKQQKNDVNQPARRPKPLPASPTVATIVAKAVTVSKLENNELVSVGRYGFALAGDVKLNYYQLLLYGSRSAVLVNLVLPKDFEYGVRENNSVEFLDKERWRLKFANTDDAVDFNSHMAFVMWKLNGPKELFWMDLHCPSHDDKVAKIGSNVEVTFVANTIQGKTFGPEVSNNIDDDRYLTVTVSEDGWERSLLGVNNNTKRIVYIPSAKMGAWKILTDGRQCLCLTLTVKKVYEVEEHTVENLPVIANEECDEFSIRNSEVTQMNNNIASNDPSVAASTKTLCIETLYKEFDKLKIENIKINERLTQLEELLKETRAEKVDNSSDSELKQVMKTVFKSIVREFPADEKFSGSQIQTKIKDLFYNALVYSNKTQSNNG